MIYPNCQYTYNNSKYSMNCPDLSCNRIIELLDEKTVIGIHAFNDYIIFHFKSCNLDFYDLNYRCEYSYEIMSCIFALNAHGKDIINSYLRAECKSLDEVCISFMSKQLGDTKADI